jgi:hypothetical protein
MFSVLYPPIKRVFYLTKFQAISAIYLANSTSEDLTVPVTSATPWMNAALKCGIKKKTGFMKS